LQKVQKPPSEPTSPSVSRTSTPPPPPSDEVDDDEPDSEGEREELNWPETPTGNRPFQNSF